MRIGGLCPSGLVELFPTLLEREELIWAMILLMARF